MFLQAFKGEYIIVYYGKRSFKGFARKAKNPIAITIFFKPIRPSPINKKYFEKANKRTLFIQTRSETTFVIILIDLIKLYFLAQAAFEHF